MKVAKSGDAGQMRGFCLYAICEKIVTTNRFKGFP
jgi:hypothetical protein